MDVDTLGLLATAKSGKLEYAYHRRLGVNDKAGFEAGCEDAEEEAVALFT